MDKLCDYIDKELEELEETVTRNGKLSRAEIEDAKNLAKLKMAILTNNAMENDGYSGRYPHIMYDDGMSHGYSRGRKRDSMGRYSSRRAGYSRDDARADMIDNLHDLMKDAPDENTRMRLQRFITELENG